MWWRMQLAMAASLAGSEGAALRWCRRLPKRQLEGVEIEWLRSIKYMSRRMSRFSILRGRYSSVYGFWSSLRWIQIFWSISFSRMPSSRIELYSCSVMPTIRGTGASSIASKAVGKIGMMLKHHLNG